MKCWLYTNGLSGHRESYLTIFEKYFNGSRVEIKDLLLKKEAVVFLMIEDSFLLYFLISILRALLGRKTVGLLFRVKPCIERKVFKLKIKYYLLRMLLKFEKIVTASILPYYLDEEISLICDGWLYDPQFWDLNSEELSFFAKLETGEAGLGELIDRYYDKNVKYICSIGTQSGVKGFEDFVNVAQILTEYKFLFAGKVTEEMSVNINVYNKRGVGENRFVSDIELLEMYALSEYVWCCYRVDYDQSSGVFGRALQLGKKVVVREGSYLQGICNKEFVSHIVIGQDSIKEVNYNEDVNRYDERERRKNLSIDFFREAIS